MCKRFHTHASHYFCIQQNNPTIYRQQQERMIEEVTIFKYLPPKLNHGLRVEDNLKRIRKNHTQICLKRHHPLEQTDHQLSKKKTTFHPEQRKLFCNK